MQTMSIRVALTLLLAASVSTAVADDHRHRGRHSRVGDTEGVRQGVYRHDERVRDRGNTGGETSGEGVPAGGGAETGGGTQAGGGGQAGGGTPPQSTLSAAGEGRRAYLKYNCYGCHGNGATGGMGPSLANGEADDVSEAVLQGEEGGMPSFRNIITTTEIGNISAYLRSIGSPDEPRFNDWWVANPVK
ncbi:MAG: hypothetical protein GC151_20635 [Betaproteobacteria bacterium]|nr:hypothetical protein [Betaproteobacteria bacterium]